MGRGLSSANATASQAPHVRPLFFVHFDWDGGDEYAHNGLGSYVWGGHTWTGIGDLGEVGPIEEGDELSPYGIEMKLNALDSTLLAIAQGTQVFGRAIEIYQGFIDDNGELVDDPELVWSGTGDTITVELGGEMDSLTLTAESDMAAHEEANGALFTNEDQQARFSGDQFFEYLDQMQDARPFWGPGGAAIYFGENAPTPTFDWRNSGIVWRKR